MCVCVCQLRGLCSICHAFDPNSLKHLEQQFTSNKTRNRTQTPCVCALIHSKIPEQNDTELNLKKKNTHNNNNCNNNSEKPQRILKEKMIDVRIKLQREIHKEIQIQNTIQIVWCKWYISALYSLDFIIKETNAKSRTKLHTQ